MSQAEADNNVYWFNTVDELMLYAAPIALVTGHYDGTRLHIYSIIDGDDANWFTLRRDCEDLSAVVVPQLYFSGGSYLRPMATGWAGDFFSGHFDRLTVINSGVYTITGLLPDDFLLNSGIVWDADLSKTMIVKTGIYNSSGYTADFDGWVDLVYNPVSTTFSGSGLVPSGQEAYYTGLGVNIYRELYEYADTGIAFYNMTGKDIDYSGYISL